MNGTKDAARFFQNRDCPHFPCHPDVAEEDFSCLFCYCPLYTLGKRCGGNWHYTEKGIKSCRDCSFPHHSGNFERVISRFEEIMAVVRKMDGTEG